MRKHWKAAALTMACLLALAGCEKETTEVLETVTQTVETETETQTQAAAETETETETGEETLSVIGERETVDGQMQSYLTGEWKDEAVVTRRPIAVMIPNNEQAMPQYGLASASIIYEAPVEGRITRLMGIFEDFDDLDHIGPVRSSRDYFVYTAMGYEAIYCNWGLARPYVEELINSDAVQNISAGVEGIHNPADEAFGRISRPGYAKEFTGYLFIDGLKEAVDRLGYDWEYDADFVPQLTFAADGVRAEYEDAQDVTVIRPGGTESNSGGYGAYDPWFEYDSDDHLYYRFQDGEAQIDERTGEQLAVSNVILQYCHGEVRDSHDYLAFGVHGVGTALVFTDGKVIPASWSRMEGDGVPPKFYDADGNEIIFNQGKTWICNIWEEYSEFVEFE
ncbi:MAG TPA: DUF3048 domain-containing protein [Candidatus Eisenbergiella merdipullorum]|uniref:DUF3048 domain-containing protein n=1 Tax=Candidatus Eisenbergiella merdipullorum TaxID=2838553 RepID=A0A9D2L101_9FIRM|nr:DUF3048 domain-containing protein [Candidatus Eisenbergiella merdipullorum]